MNNELNIEVLWHSFITEKLNKPNLKYLVELGEIANDYLLSLTFSKNSSHYYDNSSGCYYFHTLYQTNSGDIIRVNVRTHNSKPQYTGISGEAYNDLKFSTNEKNIIIELFVEFSDYIWDTQNSLSKE